MTEIDAIMGMGPVIPVLIVEDPADAKPIASALVAGGVRVLEVTLRTPRALDVIREMSEVEGAVVGAGTVLNPRDLAACMDAGARFVVSPGLTEPLARAAIDSGVPFLPGVANAGDIMRGLDLGLSRFKFFPAEASGGTKALHALSAVFGQACFCPTGGITLSSAPSWLTIPAVRCVGGSWLVPKGPVDVEAIETAARKAAALEPRLRVV
jgi:2-dehydro-3-deoxyphosphogluconate aldolase/(4S)-4-hydroxy-2-oxoglutarate aldolase